MKTTEKLSEKEEVRKRLMSIATGPRYTCPYGERLGSCKRRCYKFFTRWERFRFIINFYACPCVVLHENVVHNRTWMWIYSSDK